MTDIADFLGGAPPANVETPNMAQPNSAWSPGMVVSADTFTGGSPATSFTPETEPEKLNFIQRFQGDIDKRVMMFAEIQKATEQGEQGFGEAVFQTAGKVGAGAILDFIGQLS